MSKKNKNALDDPDVDIQNNDRILEIRTRSESGELTSIRSTVERVIDDREYVKADEIRLVATNGDSVSLNP